MATLILKSSLKPSITIHRRPLTLVKSLNEVFVVSAARTPVGSFRKSLAPLSAPLLGAKAIRATLDRAGLKGNQVALVDEVYMGQVMQAGTGQHPTRQAALGAGLPNTTPCTTVNKVCASGMKAIMMAAQSIQTGAIGSAIAGGMENMSQVPYYLQRREPIFGGINMVDGILGDGLTDAYNTCVMGKIGEKHAAKFSISREEQDEYAKASYSRSQQAAKSGLFAKEIVPVTVPVNSQFGVKKEYVVTEDEEYNKVTDFAKFATLKPVFDKSGTITAANASSINDGAAACLLMSEKAMKDHSISVFPQAKILAFCDAATDPMDFPIAPFYAVEKLLKMTGLHEHDVHVWEFNEAFSVVVLANLKLCPGIDPTKVNIHGGAVSIGHPLGMSGARITNSLVHHLKKGEKGLAAICNGGGGASAILIEKL